MQALVFHGWWIVGVAMLAQAVSVGLAIYSYGLLVLPIGSELGASRMEMMWGKTGLSLMTIVVSPILGVLLDRHSTRALMILGVLALGSAFALISVSRSPWSLPSPLPCCPLWPWHSSALSVRAYWSRDGSRPSAAAR